MSTQETPRTPDSVLRAFALRRRQINKQREREKKNEAAKAAKAAQAIATPPPPSRSTNRKPRYRRTALIEHYELVAWAFRTLEVKYPTVGKLGKISAALAAKWLRTDEPEMLDNLKLVVLWAKAEIDRGNKLVMLNNPCYLWGKSFPALVARAAMKEHGPVNLNRGYLRTGDDLVKYKEQERRVIAKAEKDAERDEEIGRAIRALNLTPEEKARPVSCERLQTLLREYRERFAAEDATAKETVQP